MLKILKNKKMNKYIKKEKFKKINSFDEDKSKLSVQEIQKNLYKRRNKELNKLIQK